MQLQGLSPCHENMGCTLDYLFHVQQPAGVSLGASTELLVLSVSRRIATLLHMPVRCPRMSGSG
jgi:hypothetical protein